MWTLYGAPGSGSAAVEMALGRAGVPFTEVRAATWEPGPGLDALRRVNPLGQIPTLVAPDGQVLTESAAILAHLGLVFPHSRLLPASDATRAQALRGLVYIAANCYVNIGILDYPERWLPGDEPAVLERLKQGARARLHACWTVFAAQFPPRGDFLLGDEPGALDLLAAVVSRWSGTRAHLAAAAPALLAVLERVESRPEFAPVFARHWPAAST